MNAGIGRPGWSGMKYRDLLRGSGHVRYGFDPVRQRAVHPAVAAAVPVPRNGRRYQRMLCWLYTVTNALALIVNLSPTASISTTPANGSPRTNSPTCGNNDNTGTVVLKGLAENWYVVLLAAALLIAALVWCLPPYSKRSLRRGLETEAAYFLVNLRRAGRRESRLAHRRHPGRIQPPDPPDHAKQRDALHRRRTARRT